MNIAGNGTARECVDAWLDMVDAGDADGSWHAAGSIFQNALSPAHWMRSLKAAREPLGALSSRVEAIVTNIDEGADAPHGALTIYQFHSVYSGRHAVVETLTVLLENFAEWKVIGYLIR